MASTKKKNIVYPPEVLEPVRQHLGHKLSDLLKKKKTLQQVDPFSDTSRLTDNAAIDDDAAEQFGHMQVSAIRSTVDRTIIQVRKALARIKIGDYGICESCGKFIDTDRLMIMPESTLCVDCEKKKEK